LKKLIFIFTFLAISLLAKETPLYIGGGLYTQQQPYIADKPHSILSPVFFYDNHIVYARWTRFGVYVTGSAKKEYGWALSFTAQPCPLGYSPEDSSALKGMTSKNSTIEAGGALDFYYKSFFIGILAMHDVLNKNNSYRGHIEIGGNFHYKNLSLYPSLMAIYQAKKFNDYYYGVTQNEAMAGRPIYTPNASVNYAFQTYIRYKVTPKWYFLGNFKAQYLAKTIQDSPIVKGKYIYSSLFSILYKFSL
jgi:MipA family protein